MTAVGSPFFAFLGSTIRRWLTAKGFAIVVIAALLPAVFVGAWAFTHRADIAVTPASGPTSGLHAGQTVNFTTTVSNQGSVAVGAFNATIAIVQPGQFQAIVVAQAPEDQQHISGLAPGESKTLTVSWNATPGIFNVESAADVSGDLGERDTNNNDLNTIIEVPYDPPTTNETFPPDLAGDANATNTTDLTIDSISWTPEAPTLEQRNLTLSAVVHNNGATPIEGASADVRVVEIFGGRSTIRTDSPQNITLGPGESKTISLVWQWEPGSFWADAYVTPPAGTHDSDASNNAASKGMVLNQHLSPDLKTQIEKQKKADFKTYYETVIISFYIALVVPLIALFYAAGVISDERDAGTLPYVLTRPIPRWLIPITKWIAGFVVVAIAVIIGLAVSYVMMFGTGTGVNGAYLVAPLAISLLALAAYLAIFVALGVYSERPYIVGTLFVIAWETIAARIQLQNAATGATQPLLPWVGNLTVLQHLNNAIAGWDFDRGMSWAPKNGQPMQALLVLAGIVVVGLIAAASWMRKRDFQVG